MSNKINRKNGEIKFQNVGRKKQHKVALFSLTEHPAELNSSVSSQNYAKNLLTHYWTQSQEYLKSKGYDNPSAYFRVIDSQVIECKPGEVWQPLFAALEERDQSTGQSGEYLAALIEHQCRGFIPWPPSDNQYEAVLDKAMIVQQLFFQLYLYEKVQSQYSAGKSRVKEAHERFLDFKEEAIRHYHELKKNNLSKRKISGMIYDKLKTANPNEDTPSLEAIRGWLKNI